MNLCLIELGAPKEEEDHHCTPEERHEEEKDNHRMKLERVLQ